MRINLYVSLFFLSLFLLSSTVAVADNGTGNRTLVAIYMVGSDLESLDDLATSDIGEMLKGIGDKNGAFDLILAYGGARKFGWDGMTVVNLTDLESDYQDGIIGNGISYQKRDSRVNMGSSDGLNQFLEIISSLPVHSRNILILWDHGGSYNGLCFDENFDMDPLDLSELQNSLHTFTIDWDLIAMDACLMGSYEIAKVTQESSHYLMVSEEVEPGHGWDYSLPFSALAQNPDMEIRDWGRVWIDAYMDNPNHEKMKKTLALIDLSKIQSIDEHLSGFSQYMEMQITNNSAYNGIGTAISDSQRYGYNPQLNQEYTVDLYDMTSRIGTNVQGGLDHANQVTAAITDAVVYQRNDGSRPGSHGLSVFSPRMKQVDEFKTIEKSSPINKNWQSFIEQYMTYTSRDSSKPLIRRLGGGKFIVTDDQGLAYVRVDTDWMPEVTNWTHSFGLKSEPIYPSEPDVYIPNPDDQTFYLKDSVTGEKVPFFHSFIGVDIGGRENFFGYVQIIRGGRMKEAVINMIRSPQNGNMSYTLFPYETNPDGKMIFSRAPVELRSGDIIIPKIVERFFGDEPRWEYTPYTPLRVTGKIEVIRDRLPYGSYLSSMTASDYNGNYALEILGSIRFPNNSTVVSSSEINQTP
ncbi:MAG TPA: clostripain-related cysteine peptidase [Methanospirillum sp.]|nr:clostripain-related cysteine peptidase [Methanospirillum sp.]